MITDMEYTKEKPRQSGYFWARENRKGGQVVRVFVSTDLLTVYSDFHPGIQFDIYDFDYWHGPLRSKNDRMPPFQT